jgi:stearoyl-CoA desaturase (delta-9 desaturase)
MSRLMKRGPDERVNWLKSMPFLILHVLPLGAVFTGFGWRELVLCVGLYYLRMFFITAGYHRYFAHRSYKLGRGMQFVMAFGGTLAAQKGVLWWAAHHRHHHRYSDKPQDVHSPLRGFWWSHLGWILCDKYSATRTELVRDLTRYPELVWLNRHWWLPPTLLGAACLLLGGASYLFVGFFLSTVLLYHGTFSVNSIAHLFGRRRYATTDTSRNSFLVALITCGEGWHNNHHHLQSTVKAGFYWWELDLSYYALRALSWIGLARGLRQPAQAKLLQNRIKDGHFDVGMFEAYWTRAVHTLAEAQQRAGKYYDAKKRALEEYASRTMLEAHRHAGDFYDAKRKALEDLVESTKKTAEDFGIVQKGTADASA